MNTPIPSYPVLMSQALQPEPESMARPTGLSPCPCCGAHAEFDQMSSSMHYVKCSNEDCGIKTKCHPSKDTAKACWEKRTKTEQQAAEEKIDEFMRNQNNRDALDRRVMDLKKQLDKDVSRIGKLVAKNKGFFNARTGQNTITLAADYLESAVAGSKQNTAATQAQLSKAMNELSKSMHEL